MTIYHLDATLERYERAIAKLKANKSAIEVEQVTEEQVIKVLNARNDVQLALQEVKSVPTSRLQQVIELDDRLRGLAAEIIKVIKSERWAKLRASVHSPGDAWWWNLETFAPPPVHKWDRLDWLWNGLTIGVWTGNLSLLLNIGTRFLGGGAGFFGAVAVIFPSIMALLQAKSDLKAGKTALDRLLTNLITKFKIPPYFHEEAKLGSTLIMFFSFLALWSSLPLISQIYNFYGLQDIKRFNVGAAEQNYLKAISLDSDNLDAHFNLGFVYEELQEFDKAKKHYLIAIRGNIPDAYNNLAYFYIKNNKKGQYTEAAAFLVRGLELAEEQDSQPEEKYNLLKNLGWVRLKQGRTQEAQTNLREAIKIAQNPNTGEFVRNSAAAHCILGQVLDPLDNNQKSTAAALEQWQKCCKLAEQTDPDEDRWLHQARQKLKKAGRRCTRKSMGNSQNS